MLILVFVIDDVIEKPTDDALESTNFKIVPSLLPEIPGLT
jgi:hypothetical protein